jgi:hypothetical protein
MSKDEWRIERCGLRHVAAGLWEHPTGYRFWEKIALADLPNDLIGVEDLERFGITLVEIGHMAAVEKP